MKLLLQDLSKGDTSVVQAPAPCASAGHLLINSTLSLISAGTERMLVDFGKADYMAKVKIMLEE